MHLSNALNNKSKVIADLRLLKVGREVGPLISLHPLYLFYYWSSDARGQGGTGDNHACFSTLPQAAVAEPSPAFPSLELMNQCK